MRTELSNKNKNHINKYRYLELKNYCLQYPDWVHDYYAADQVLQTREFTGASKSSYISDPTANYAIVKEQYSKHIKNVEKAAWETDEFLFSYILKGVTEGLSYDVMNAKDNIPCSRDTYYDRYRRFFFILDKIRD